MRKVLRYISLIRWWTFCLVQWNSVFPRDFLIMSRAHSDRAELSECRDSSMVNNWICFQWKCTFLFVIRKINIWNTVWKYELKYNLILDWTSCAKTHAILTNIIHLTDNAVMNMIMTIWFPLFSKWCSTSLKCFYILYIIYIPKAFEQAHNELGKSWFNK